MPQERTSDKELVALFREFGSSVGSRAPLYANLSEAIAQDSKSDVRGLLNSAQLPQRRPVLLLAAIHRIVLENQGSPLAQWYPSVTGVAREQKHDLADLTLDLNEFCDTYRNEIINLVRTRHTQTNDISRSALLRLALAHQPVVNNSALIDVGCSAGLNLHLDAYHCTYTAENGSWTISAGDTAAPALRCSVRAEVTPDIAVGTFTQRIGYDPHPIDVRTDDAMWLLACVWPDQLDRIARLKSAIEWMKQNPVELRSRDALGALDEVEEMNDSHITIINSWVLSYLSDDDQREYRQRLEHLGQRRDLTWVYLEQPSTTSALQHDASIANDPKRSEFTAITRIDWHSGTPQVRHLGTMHPHGYWFHPS